MRIRVAACLLGCSSFVSVLRLGPGGLCIRWTGPRGSSFAVFKVVIIKVRATGPIATGAARNAAGRQTSSRNRRLLAAYKRYARDPDTSLMGTRGNPCALVQSDLCNQAPGNQWEPGNIEEKTDEEPGGTPFA